MKLDYDFLPTYIQEIVQKLADVYQIDSDYVLTGLFAVVAATQGDRYQVIDPKGYCNATALWLCHVAVSGYGKSGCTSWLMQPLLDFDEARHLEYLKKKERWMVPGNNDEEKPPVEKKLVLNDYTPEALFDAMEKAGVNGIILYRDELAGWLKDIGRYGKSGEVEQYLSAWSQKMVRNTRLMRDDNFVKRPCFNVLGGMQPEILHEMLGKSDLIGNGFNSRLLFVFEDASLHIKYFKENIPDSMKVAYEHLIERLLHTSTTEVRFSCAAEKSFIEYWEDLQLLISTSKGMYRQLLSKLQIYVEKWAGIIHLLADDGTPYKEISGNTMDIAISHMKAFEEWALKAYSLIQPDRDIIKNGPIVNKTETLQLLNYHYPNMKKNLVAEGLGISRSLLSPSRNKVPPLEVNMNNEVTN